MNRMLEVCLVAGTLIASVGAAQSATPTGAKSFAGTWEGTMNDLPGINLKIDQADTTIAGTVVFYLQQRSDPNGRWHATAESALPLLSPHVEDSTLTFEIEHHRCHGCAELDPNVKFRMQLTGPNEARLWNLNDAADSDPGLRLVRRTAATTPAAVSGVPQAMQRGVSVVMAPTTNAVPMPEADNADAWIVAVVRDGSLFFGTEKVTPAGLEDEMKSHPRNREQKLYIKADARAQFAEVEKVLVAGRAVSFESAVLLTSQPEPSAPGTIVPPKGLEVIVGVPPGAELPVVQITEFEQPSPKLTVNGADVSDGALAGTLKRMLRNRNEKIVVLKADGQLPFARVVHVIDACRWAGAKVVLATPEQ